MAKVSFYEVASFSNATLQTAKTSMDNYLANIEPGNVLGEVQFAQVYNGAATLYIFTVTYLVNAI